LGVIQGVFAVIGGLLAAKLDGWLGPKRAVQVELTVVLVGQLAILGSRPDMILYMPASAAPVWGGPLFATAPELAFLALGLTSAVGVTAAYASSRTLLVRLVPADATGRFFGLYTLSGNATYWLAPLLIEVFTRALGTQQAGFYPIVGLLLIGLAILSFVRVPQR
jgi:MFS transporter, UMF1 family